MAVKVQELGGQGTLLAGNSVYTAWAGGRGDQGQGGLGGCGWEIGRCRESLPMGEPMLKGSGDTG